jgi:hypothetical protein
MLSLSSTGSLEWESSAATRMEWESLAGSLEFESSAARMEFESLTGIIQKLQVNEMVIIQTSHSLRSLIKSFSIKLIKSFSIKLIKSFSIRYSKIVNRSHDHHSRPPNLVRTLILLGFLSWKLDQI